MITAIHSFVYSDDAAATRAFLRDVVQWPFVDDVASEPGWLIFQTGPSEMGVHPTRCVWDGKEYNYPRQHKLQLLCDDIESTRAELEQRGGTFVGPIAEYGFGFGCLLEVPGADPIMLCQPKHATAYNL